MQLKITDKGKECKRLVNRAKHHTLLQDKRHPEADAWPLRDVPAFDLQNMKVHINLAELRERAAAD